MEGTLRPDSLKNSGTWIIVKDEEGPEDKEMGIRRVHEFYPSNMKSKADREVIVVTHGTWGSESPQYHKDADFTEKQKQNYRDIKRFISWYSFASKKPVDLLSFKWSGELSDEARLKASNYLKSRLEGIYPLKTPISFISHSHGCNIINNLSQTLHLPINMIIHLACPKRISEEKYHPKNFKQLIYFYSLGDAIEPLGKIPEAQLPLVATTMIATHLILFFLDFNKSIDKSITLPSFFLPSLFSLQTASMYIRCGLPYMAAANYFKSEDNSSVIGLRTTINGKKPGHSDIFASGHPEITDVLQLLPEILTKLYREYPAHVAQSFTANLDLESSEQGEYSNEPIKLSNIKKYDRHAFWNKIHHKKPHSIPFIALKSKIQKPNQVEDLENLGSLDEWCNSHEKNEILVQVTDEYDYAIELVKVENNFTENDLEKELQKTPKAKMSSFENFLDRLLEKK